MLGLRVTLISPATVHYARIVIADIRLIEKATTVNEEQFATRPLHHLQRCENVGRIGRIYIVISLASTSGLRMPRCPSRFPESALRLSQVFESASADFLKESADLVSMLKQLSMTSLPSKYGGKMNL